MKIELFITVLLFIFNFSGWRQQDKKEKLQNQVRQYWFVLLTKGNKKL